MKVAILLVLIHVIFLYIYFGGDLSRNDILQNSSSSYKFNLLSAPKLEEQSKSQTQIPLNSNQTETTPRNNSESQHQDFLNNTTSSNETQTENQNNKTVSEETNSNNNVKNVTHEESDDYSPEEEQENNIPEKPFYKMTFPNPKPFDDELRSMQIPEGTYIEFLEISCAIHSPDHLNIIIRDGKRPRFEIPQKDPYPHSSNPQYLTLEESNFELITQLDPFDIIVKRKLTQEIIFKLTDRFIFTDFYIEFTFQTPTNEIYGLGSRISTLQFKPGTYSLFMIDRAGAVDTGQPGYNGQGHHPMYLMKEKSGKYHTFLLRNVNFQELIIRDEPKVTWKVIGGVLDFNFFLGGGSPESAVEKYHEYLGGWAMPAFWHLGYHLNKWAGYKSVKDLEYVLDAFHQRKIPLDSLWTDADHMKDHNNFSIDEENFPLDQVRDLYSKYKKKWVVLLNAHVSLPLLPPASEYSQISQLFMKDSLDETCDGSFLWGKVNFLDFLHPRSKHFWGKMLDSVHQKWDYAGVWLDANEVSNLEKKDSAYYRKAWSRKYYFLPFYPGEKNYYYLNIINVDCIHYKEQDEFNVRTFNALLQTKYTYDILLKRSPFPFVLSRATLFGGGKYAFTWIPDVWSDWDSFKTSLAGVLAHNIFGYAMAGVDVCGFVSATMTEPELCARWHQLAVFYPFARNSHIFNGRSSTNQEPYRYNGIFYNTILQAIRQRYSLLKYMYTQFITKKTRVGTIVRPLFFEFHNDSNLPPYGSRVHEEQFLLGDSIMIAPVFEERKESVALYFPNTRWYDLRNYEEILAKGDFMAVQAKLTEPIPFFLREGAIFFTQEVDETVLSTQDLGNVFAVFIGLDEVGRAKGNIIAASDFGEENIHKECIKNNCILTIDIQLGNDNNQLFLTVQLQEGSEENQELQQSFTVNQLIIMGIPEEVRRRESLKQTVLENHTELPIETNLLETGALKLNFESFSFKTQMIYKFLFS